MLMWTTGLLLVRNWMMLVRWQMSYTLVYHTRRTCAQNNTLVLLRSWRPPTVKLLSCPGHDHHKLVKCNVYDRLLRWYKCELSALAVTECVWVCVSVCEYYSNVTHSCLTTHSLRCNVSTCLSFTSTAPHLYIHEFFLNNNNAQGKI